MFGVEDTTKELKNALQQVDCNMGRVKEWQKLNERMKKQLPSVQSKYENARGALIQIDEDGRRLEELLVDKEGYSKEELREMQGLLKDMKRLDNSFTHEFLVSNADKEFCQIYGAILKLGDSFIAKGDNRILLKSEVENLLALSKEILEREQPNMRKLCYFYQNYSPENLLKITPAEGLATIEAVFKEEYIDPMVELLKTAVVRADQRTKELEAEESRRAKKELTVLEPLLEGSGSEDLMGRVDRLFYKMAE